MGDADHHDVWAECHDLLHRPFTRACWVTPGGWARHVRLWWEFQGWPLLARRVLCRLGRHRWVPYWDASDPGQVPDGLVCLRCGL